MGFFKKKDKDLDYDPFFRFQWRLREEYQTWKRDDITTRGRYIPMSVDKAQRVIDQIRGRSYEEALMILELMPYRACYPIFKLLYSAAANAKYNRNFNKANLIITKVEVNKGTTMKKLKPRARGRSYMIQRATCHITIVLRDKTFFDRYDNYLKSHNPVKLTAWFNELPRGRRIEVFSGRFMEKYRLKSLFYSFEFF